MQQNRYENSLNGISTEGQPLAPGDNALSQRTLFLVVAAALLALFLGALDALVVGAAMPTIVADLGGLHLYSWVFSAYLLTRAISLPIFGKLCDLFSSKKLYIIAISVFLVSSILAGVSRSMSQLIFSRALQGVGAGGNFALAYIVIADLSPPERRGKMMGLISFVWGIASVLGPAMGGFVVAYASWRWIFYINLPLGSAALLGIVFYLRETREKKRGASVDFLGALSLSAAVLALLIAFMMGGRNFHWISPQIAGLLVVFAGAGLGFYHAERRAKEPILTLSFFRVRAFSMGNCAAFFSSFAVFSLSAFGPLFIQGALGKTPAQLGIAMVPLSLGWSVGALLCGQLVNRLHEKPASFLGAFLLMLGTGLTVAFSTSTPLVVCSLVFALAGVGMGFVSIGTLLLVQNSLEASDLGVATSSHQFARTLGGTIGIGVSGSFVSVQLTKALESMADSPLGKGIPENFANHLATNVQSLLQPEMQTLLSPAVQSALQEAIATGVKTVFWAALGASLLSLVFCYLLPNFKKAANRSS